MYIAVCVYRYVITMGLCSKYDVDGQYSRFAAQILANPQYDVTLLCYISQLYCMQTFNIIKWLHDIQLRHVMWLS